MEEILFWAVIASLCFATSMAWLLARRKRQETDAKRLPFHERIH